MKKPLDAARLEELALAYVARYATTSAKLERYLARKLRERGWQEDEPQPDIAALVARYCELGYIDDEAYARSRSGSLLRRGYGGSRVDQALFQAGVDAEIRADVAPGEPKLRRAALALARKRRFGPFGAQEIDRPLREKQIAAMVRAGHSFDRARAMVDAPGEAQAEEWALEADEDEESHED